MTLKGFSQYQVLTALPVHIKTGKQIMDFVTDFGEDCDVILEYDDVNGPFSFLFTGTTLSIQVDPLGIYVVDFDPETCEETVLEIFSPGELNKATYWLITQVNQANQPS